MCISRKERIQFVLENGIVICDRQRTIPFFVREAEQCRRVLIIPPKHDKMKIAELAAGVIQMFCLPEGGQVQCFY